MADFKRWYKDSWSFIKDSRNFIFFIIFLFLFSMLVGVLFPNFFEDEIRDYLTSLFDQVKDYGFLELFLFIVKNNLTTALSSVILGLVFGVMPVFSSVINGYVLGFVSGRSVDIAGLSILGRLIPHSIFELPAIFISAGIGLRLGLAVFSKDSRKNFSLLLKDSVIAFVLFIIPLLIIAGFIESLLIHLL